LGESEKRKVVPSPEEGIMAKAHPREMKAFQQEAVQLGESCKKSKSERACDLERSESA
jgi:hypothetical protein